MSQSVQHSLFEHAATTAFYTGFSAFVAGAFTTINPIAGAIFGATSNIGTRAINWVLDKNAVTGNNNGAKIIKFAISFFSGIGIGSLMASASGFPVTFVGGLVLTACELGTMFATGLLVAGLNLAINSRESARRLPA